MVIVDAAVMFDLINVGHALTHEPIYNTARRNGHALTSISVHWPQTQQERLSEPLLRF